MVIFSHKSRGPRQDQRHVVRILWWNPFQQALRIGLQPTIPTNVGQVATE